jgi:uncharacterized protein
MLINQWSLSAMTKNHRRCISCRWLAERQEFWRVVRVGNLVQLEVGMGRSAYLCPTSSCLAAAQKKNRLARALRAPVRAEIYQQLAQRLAAGQNASL